MPARWLNEIVDHAGHIDQGNERIESAIDLHRQIRGVAYNRMTAAVRKSPVDAASMTYRACGHIMQWLSVIVTLTVVVIVCHF
jgi:hypothetical protein